MKRSTRKKKTSRKCRGPVVSIREYKSLSGPGAFEVWVDGNSVFCSTTMDAHQLIKLLRKIGIPVESKNAKDYPDHDISDW